MSKDNERQAMLDPALGDARVLALRLLEALLPASSGKDAAAVGPSRDERTRRLASAELPSLMLYAGVLVRAHSEQREAAVKGALKPTSRRRRPLRRAELKGLITQEPRPADLATRIVEDYVRHNPLVTTRAHYNLACFYSTLATLTEGIDSKRRCQDLAIAELELAVHDAALLSWTQQDPALRDLKKARGAEWEELITRFTPAAHETSASTAAEQGELAESAVPVETEASRPDRARWSMADQAVVIFAEGLRVAGATPIVGPGSEVDYEVRTPDGVILVEVKIGREDLISRAEVEKYVAQAERWVSSNHAEPRRMVLLTDVELTDTARQVASEYRVDVVRV